jgi:hypothetical protein
MQLSDGSGEHPRKVDLMSRVSGGDTSTSLRRGFDLVVLTRSSIKLPTRTHFISSKTSFLDRPPDTLTILLVIVIRYRSYASHHSVGTLYSKTTGLVQTPRSFAYTRPGPRSLSFIQYIRVSPLRPHLTSISRYQY